MKTATVAFAMLATAFLSSCGGGGSSAPSTAATGALPPVSGSTSQGNAQKSAATFSITIPARGAAASQSSRNVQYVSPATATVYISLEDTPGHGDSTYSFTEQVNSTNCTTTSQGETCSFTAEVPIGTDNFSVLTADANNVPLGYVNATITISVGGTNALGPQGQLSPIIAGAVPSYAFQAITIMYDGHAPIVAPAVTTAIFDADGNPLSLGVTGDSPIGNAYSTVTAAQTVGQFTADVTSLNGAVVYPSAPESTATYGAAVGSQYLVEIGNGTTSQFTTVLTLTTPQVQFTRTEFPQLPWLTLTVPPSSSSITLTCQFTTPTPTTDPCPATAPATFNVF